MIRSSPVEASPGIVVGRNKLPELFPNVGSIDPSGFQDAFGYVTKVSAFLGLESSDRHPKNWEEKR
jgi:hypothetical protein